MKKITKKWLEFAQRDLQNAIILFNAHSYEGAVYSCHQAIEKTIKSLLVEKDKRIPKIHDLPKLYHESGVDGSASVLNFLEEINPYYNPIRYPDAAVTEIHIKRNQTKKYIDSTKETIKWLKNQLTR